MRIERILVWLTSLTLGGCFSGAPLDLPWPPQAQSVLILRQDPPQIIALERGKSQFTINKNETVVALFYDQPLRTYDLSYGRSETTSEPARPLPAPIQRSHGHLGTGGFEWFESPPSLEDLQAYRLPPIDLAACLEDGRCLSIDGERCHDCAPSLPIGPAAVTTQCPWDASLSLGQCRPKVVTHEPCPFGQRSLWNAQACEPLSACTESADGYPANAPSGPGVTYIQAAGQPGDGSRTRPFNSLAAAHASGSRQGTWVLGAGAFAAGLEFGADTDLQIMGVCAERTQLSSDTATLIARGARLDLQQLHIQSTGPEALVGEDAELTLSSCEIGPAIDATITTTGGTLKISNSSLRNLAGGIGQSGGTLNIQDSTFEVPMVLSSADSSSTSIRRTTMVDPDLGVPSTAVFIERCRACSISQSRISRRAGAAIHILDATLVKLFDISIVQNNRIYSAIGIVIGGSIDPTVEVDRVEMSKIYISGMTGHGIHSEARRLQGSNLFLKDNLQSGLVILRRFHPVMTADLSDIYIADMELPALLIHGVGHGLEGPKVNIKGLTFHRSVPAERNAQSCLIVRDLTTLTIDGMAVTGLHWNLGILDTSNIELSNLSAGPTKASAFELNPTDYASIRNSRLGASPTQTIIARASPGLISLEDVRIVGAETALLSEGSSHLAFSNLLIEDTRTCIDLNEDAKVSARGGHLKCSGTGIRYGKYEDLVGALPGVKVDAKPAFAQSGQ